MHISGIANNAVSFSELDIILNNNESNSMYFSAMASTFPIADLALGNLFWTNYRYMSLK